MKDLISRQKAIDAFKLSLTIEGLGLQPLITVDDVIKTLNVLPSEHPEPQWIPVTKKAHPDLPIRVQVQMDNGWIITAYYQEGEWLSVPDCGEPLQVEAWRELPEPYDSDLKISPLMDIATH